MGSNSVIPASGSFLSRNSKDKDYFNSIHIVKVIDVDVPSGLIRVGNPVNDILSMPLLGLSVPIITEGGTVKPDSQASSWGRYIPQVGDMVLVAFATDGRPYSVGYSTISYDFMSLADAETASKGGTGWGYVAEKSLKPGDWDFKASRGGSLYLGDKVHLASSVCSFTLSQSTQDLTLSAPLSLQKAGNSIIRYGGARRLILPTDTSETFIYAIPPRGIPAIAHEYTIDLRWNNLVPGGGSLVYFSMGDVIDDITKIAQVSSNVFPVRRTFSAMDTTGLIPSYSETVDSNGNYEVEALTAISYKWTTPLAAWEILNLSTDISSTTTMNLSSITGMTLDSKTTMDMASIGAMTLDSKLTVDISATAVVTLDSALIKLGGAAISPAVKGTELTALITPLLAALAAASVTGGAAPPLPVNFQSAWIALGTAVAPLTALLALILSKKVMVE